MTANASPVSWKVGVPYPQSKKWGYWYPSYVTPMIKITRHVVDRSRYNKHWRCNFCPLPVWCNKVVYVVHRRWREVYQCRPYPCEVSLYQHVRVIMTGLRPLHTARRHPTALSIVLSRQGPITRRSFPREAFPRDDAQGYVSARGNVPLCIVARKRFARKRSVRYPTPTISLESSGDSCTTSHLVASLYSVLATRNGPWSTSQTNLNTKQNDKKYKLITDGYSRSINNEMNWINYTQLNELNALTTELLSTISTATQMWIIITT